MERVMVVEDARVRPLVQGPFSQEGRDQVYELALGSHRFMDRPAAEVDPAWRQVIPYVVVRHGDRWLLLRRTTRQTEARLHHRLSLGVGGHINPSEVGTPDPILAGMRRELEEEVALQGVESIRYMGVIQDDTDAVSRVHLGLVFLARVTSSAFEVREPHKMSAVWATAREIREQEAHLETWSRVLLDPLLMESP